MAPEITSPMESDRFQAVHLLFQEIIKNQRKLDQKNSQSEEATKLLSELATVANLELEKKGNTFFLHGETLLQPVQIDDDLTPAAIASKILSEHLKTQQTLESLRPHLEKRYQSLQLRPVNDVAEAVGWYLHGLGVQANEAGALRMIQELQMRERLTLKTLEAQLGDKAKGLKPLSFGGSTSVIYTDAEETYAYKVYVPDNEDTEDEAMEFGEKSQRYSNHEIDVVQRLGAAHICPDDPEKLSRPSKLNAGESLPAVVVMERVAIGLPTKEELPLLVGEIARLSRELSLQNAKPDGAAEVVWDEKTKRLLILDPAELQDEPITQEEAALWITRRIARLLPSS